MTHSKLRPTAARCGALILIAGCICAAFCPVAEAALVTPAAPLDPDASRVHPDVSLGLAGNPFNIFVGGSLPGEWFLENTMSGVPGMGTMDVIVYSQVWEHDDGHLLFAYQIENNSTAHVRKGNIKGYGSGVCAVVDGGVLDRAGDGGFDAGDVLQLTRHGGGSPQLAFAFEAPDDEGQMVERLLAPGATSAWFYAETDASEYGTDPSTVIDGGQSADMMEVFVPVPEPAALGLLAAGLGAMLARRRSRR